ncbi:MAG TPA: hypothetical protein VGB52_07660 [Actinomycetota bacterium]
MALPDDAATRIAGMFACDDEDERAEMMMKLLDAMDQPEAGTALATIAVGLAAETFAFTASMPGADPRIVARAFAANVAAREHAAMSR